MYRISRLGAMQQFHVARRLAPLLTAFGDIAAAKKVATDNMLQAIKPIASVLSTMSDEDVEYIIQTCLSVCERKQEINAANFVWANVQERTSKTICFQDIDMSIMVELTVAVIQENLGSFFPI